MASGRERERERRRLREVERNVRESFKKEVGGWGSSAQAAPDIAGA